MKNGPSDSVFATCFASALIIGKVYVSWNLVFYHHSNTLLPYAHAYHSCSTCQ